MDEQTKLTRLINYIDMVDVSEIPQTEDEVKNSIAFDDLLNHLPVKDQDTITNFLTDEIDRFLKIIITCPFIEFNEEKSEEFVSKLDKRIENMILEAIRNDE